MRTLPILALLIGALTLDASGQSEPADQTKTYEGYAWPIAPGCHQRKKPYPSFGNNVRTRKDGSKRAHLGEDIIPPATDGHIYIVKDGIVFLSRAAHLTDWGNYVMVDHADGLRTVYAHLVEPSKLRSGQKVKQGDIVGVAGETETIYVHLHFEFQGSGKNDWTRGRIDPVSILVALDKCSKSAKKESTA